MQHHVLMFGFGGAGGAGLGAKSQVIQSKEDSDAN